MILLMVRLERGGGRLLPALSKRVLYGDFGQKVVA